MKSASAYTNAKRVNAITSNNKVEYPGKVAKNIQPLAASCPIDPNFEVLEYKFKSHKCDKKTSHSVINCN